MSRKNDELLYRNGRNQFGITSEDLPKYSNIDQWPQIKREFIDFYKESWLILFSGLNKKEIWQKLHGNSESKFRKTSLNEFYSILRSAKSTEHYLEQYLLENKDFALK